MNAQWILVIGRRESLATTPCPPAKAHFDVLGEPAPLGDGPGLSLGELLVEQIVALDVPPSLLGVVPHKHPELVEPR
jgi:hypothetical protein